MRMWVEIRINPQANIEDVSHPPCEDVSWNAGLREKGVRFYGHPPCEDVSWNI